MGPIGGDCEPGRRPQCNNMDPLSGKQQSGFQQIKNENANSSLVREREL